MLHGNIAFFMGLTSQNTWTYALWSGFGAFCAALFDFGLLVTVIHHVRVHHQAVREHHALLEDHHRTLLQALIEKEVSA